MSKHLLILVFYFLCASSFAGVDEGISYVKNGDYFKALNIFSPLAEQGDPDAQYNLGLMYISGQGVPRDLIKASTWFAKAAKANQVEAQYWLGSMYSNGQGVSQDFKLAAYWLKIAAEKGHAHAQTNLGVLYNHGKGVSQDYELAKYWLMKAADQGDYRAQFNLGAFFETTFPVNDVLAHSLYKFSAKNSPDSFTDPAKYRDLISKRMTPNQLIESEKLTRELSKPNNVTKTITAYLEKK